MAAASGSEIRSDMMAAGHGRITCTLNGSTVAFSELSSTYPLKLLSPRLAANAVAIVYMMSYGGGLVCGDRIKLQVRAEGGSRLLLLSQVARLSIRKDNIDPHINRDLPRSSRHVIPTVPRHARAIYWSPAH